MKILVISVGKPGLAYARAGVAEYLGRMRPAGSIQWLAVKAGDRETEGQRLLAAAEGMVRVVLDQRGEPWTSRGLAEKIGGWEMRAVKGVAFLVGGAGGHDPAVRAAADHHWSLGSVTMQHELALVVLLEQLYRAQTIRRGEPYHRD